MKLKNKGKVYPSPSSACSPETDALSVLKLLPAAILALASLLSLEDREVLAYLITRSLKTTTNGSSTSQSHDSKKKSAKKPPTGTAAAAAAAQAHKPPMFDCECFDCYTSYWFRWDSSPNRELINQAIEAFEDHLANGEQSKKTARGKRRDKSGRRVAPNEKPVDVSVTATVPIPSPEPPLPEVLTLEEISPLASPVRTEAETKEVIGEMPELAVAAVVEAEAVEEEVAPAVNRAAATSHKGLARKVLPDVLGLFNSRLWSLWSPNV